MVRVIDKNHKIHHGGPLLLLFCPAIHRLLSGRPGLGAHGISRVSVHFIVSPFPSLKLGHLAIRHDRPCSMPANPIYHLCDTQCDDDQFHFTANVCVPWESSRRFLLPVPHFRDSWVVLDSSPPRIQCVHGGLPTTHSTHVKREWCIQLLPLRVAH